MPSFPAPWKINPPAARPNLGFIALCCPLRVGSLPRRVCGEKSSQKTLTEDVARCRDHLRPGKLPAGRLAGVVRGFGHLRGQRKRPRPNSLGSNGVRRGPGPVAGKAGAMGDQYGGLPARIFLGIDSTILIVPFSRGSEDGVYDGCSVDLGVIRSSIPYRQRSVRISIALWT